MRRHLARRHLLLGRLRCFLSDSSFVWKRYKTRSPPLFFSPLKIGASQPPVSSNIYFFGAPTTYYLLLIADLVLNVEFHLITEIALALLFKPYYFVLLTEGAGNYSILQSEMHCYFQAL